MPQYGFGSGELWSIAEGANRTPRRFGELQEISVDISVNVKELMGQNRFPVAIATGAGKIELKAKAAKIYGRQWAEIMFGDTGVSSGQRRTVANQAGTVATATITVGQTNIEDLGAIRQATGVTLRKVASAPAVDEYSVNLSTGVYTFNAAENGNVVLISYIYVPTGPTAGWAFSVSNTPMGQQTFFSVTLSNSFDANNLTMTFQRCIAKKLMLATKLEDFIVPELDISAFAAVDGSVLKVGVSQE